MRLKNEDGWSLGEVASLCIICLAVLVSVYALRIDTYGNNAKVYFGISAALDLSDDEKTMLKPMVAQQLRILIDNARNAELAESALGNRNDISPATADKAVAELRAAQAKKKEAARNLNRACKTARYFSFIPPKDSEWCK